MSRYSRRLLAFTASLAVTLSGSFILSSGAQASTAPTAASPTETISSAAVSRPSAPQKVSGKPGDRSVLVSWSKPRSTGGADIREYRVYVASSEAGPWRLSGRSTQNTSFNVSGLSNGSEYWFAVSAVNSAGEGERGSSTSSFTPRTKAGAPLNLVATRGDKQVSLSWEPPTSDGGSPIATYTVYMSKSSRGPWSKVGSPAADAVREVTRLTNGTTYWFKVAANNAAGEGVSSTARSATPAALPGVPRSLSATPRNASVALTWAAPTSTGGLPITGYRVYISDVSRTGPWESVGSLDPKLSRVVTGLTNGTEYWFAVTAQSSVGESVQATTSGVKPRTVPSAPLNLNATPSDGAVTLEWNAPANEGGVPVTTYTVYMTSTSASGPWSKVGSSSSLDRKVTRLKNGTTYWFRVTATNIAGEGAAALSTAISPATLASAPQKLTATAGNASATVTWSAPKSDGGTRLLGYNVYYSQSSSSSGDWTLFSSASPSTTAQVTGLANGERYWFKVAAVTAVGEGDDAITRSSVTPFTVPDAVQNLVGEADDGEVALEWDKPFFDGGANITDYIVYFSSASTGGWQLAPKSKSTRTSITITGLRNGESYSFRVAAVNAAGAGAETLLSGIIPLGDFIAPTVTSATISNSASEQVTLFFTPGDAGGRKISSYEYSIDGGKTWLAPVAYTAASLLTQPSEIVQVGYAYRVRAVATNGDYSPASKSTSRPSGAPSLTVTARPSVEGQGAGIDVSWKTTTSATFYKVYRVVDSKIRMLGNFGPELTRLSESNLPWNKSYGYRIAACNAGGCSSYSSTGTVTTAPTPANWSVSSPEAGVVEITMNKLPAGALSVRVKMCDRTANPSCDPNTSATINTSYNKAGPFRISSVKENRTYAVTVVSFQKTNGLGLNTVGLTKTVQVK